MPTPVQITGWTTHIASAGDVYDVVYLTNVDVSTFDLGNVRRVLEMRPGIRVDRMTPLGSKVLNVRLNTLRTGQLGTILGGMRCDGDCDGPRAKTLSPINVFLHGRLNAAQVAVLTAAETTADAIATGVEAAGQIVNKGASTVGTAAQGIVRGLPVSLPIIILVALAIYAGVLRGQITAPRK